MRVTSAALGVGGGEHSVDQHERSHNLCSQSISLGVTMIDSIRSSTLCLVEVRLEAFHDSGSGHRTQALHDHVVECTVKRHLSRQEESESHGWVDVSSCRDITALLDHYTS